MTLPDRPASEIAFAANAPCRLRPSVGFFCWNSNEVGRILEIARSLENGCIVIGRRNGLRFGPGNPIFEMEEAVFTDAAVPVVVWPEDRMLEFDGFFEVIVCQAPFIGSEEVKESRVVNIPEGGDCRAIVQSAMNSVPRE